MADGFAVETEHSQTLGQTLLRGCCFCNDDEMYTRGIFKMSFAKPDIDMNHCQVPEARS